MTTDKKRAQRQKYRATKKAERDRAARALTDAAFADLTPDDVDRVARASRLLAQRDKQRKT